MPPDLPDVLMRAMGLPLLPAPSSPSTPVRANENWPDELAELMSIPEVVACLAELDVHKMEDVIDVIDVEEGHDKMLMAVVEALPTKPRKKKLFRNRVTMAANNLLQLLAIFIEYDKDEDGFLSRVECLRIPEHKAVSKSGELVGEAFDAMDENKDGRISFEELFDHCIVVDSEEGVPPADAEKEMEAARAAAASEKAAHEEMQAMKREQAALAAAQREQAAAQATQDALAQQRAQIDEQARELRLQQAEFERKAQSAAMDAQRKMDEAGRQLELQAIQQAKQLENQMAQVHMRTGHAGTFSGRPGTHKISKNNLKYANLPLDGYLGQKNFHHINTEYPGLQLVHEKPYVFVVNNFLSSDECGLLLDKAVRLQPQEGVSLVNEKGGARGAGNKAGQTSSRNSKGCILHNEEIPRLRERFSKLALVDTSQLQPLKVSRYDKGDQFGKHVDAITVSECQTDEDWFGDLGRAKSGLHECPFPGGNRFMTSFVYLNDVEHGGHTDFHWTNSMPSFYDNPRPRSRLEFPPLKPAPELGISIKPEEGMAVLFFPACTPEMGGITDINAQHAGAPAIDTKFICQQFIWSHKFDASDAPEKAPTSAKPDMSSVF
eukprot:COSAG02_NODE_1842_length_10700_cov_148.785869_3_plen_606_part_00